MNKGVQLRIGHVPWRYTSGVIQIPGLELEAGTPWRLKADSQESPIVHVRPEEGPKDPNAFAAYARKAAGRAVPLVLGPYLRSDLRSALEKARVSYLDFYGNVHIEAPGVLVHVRSPARAAASRGLGVAGRRAAQTMLEFKERAWAVTELAELAQVSSGHAQNVMRVLEANDLVYTEGRGPKKRRRIREPTRFLDWLVSQEPARRPRVQLECALHARAPQELWAKVDHALGPHRAYALTGAAGASVLGAGPSAVPRTLVRIKPDLSLRSVAERLKAEVTTRGPNLVLWTDTGLLGTVTAFREHDVVLAPHVRIYLDARQEQRGEDVATSFREQILGY
jgi:hypothetical protein